MLAISRSLQAAAALCLMLPGLATAGTYVFLAAPETDLNRVPQIIADAVAALPFVLTETEKPECDLKSFGESAVNFVHERAREPLFEESPVRKLKKELLDSFFVLFRLEAAGAVNQDSVWLEQAGYPSQNLKLKLPHSGQTVRLQSPAYINAATHHARVGAGNVNQDTIE